MCPYLKLVNKQSNRIRPYNWLQILSRALRRDFPDLNRRRVDCLLGRTQIKVTELPIIIDTPSSSLLLLTLSITVSVGRSPSLLSSNLGVHQIFRTMATFIGSAISPRPMECIICSLTCSSDNYYCSLPEAPTTLSVPSTSLDDEFSPSSGELMLNRQTDSQRIVKSRWELALYTKNVINAITECTFRRQDQILTTTVGNAPLIDP